MKPILKQYQHMWMPGYGWWDTTPERNPWWPFNNDAILQRVAVFGMLFLAAAILWLMSEVGAWLITNLFALFG